MKSQSRSARKWGVMVAGLCVLWFAQSAGAASLQSWDDIIPNANQRFKVLTEFGGLAVLDQETQLVWERSPGPGVSPRSAGFLACLRSSVGGRMGWRLPSVVELATLYDPSVTGSNPSLPPGHPFNLTTGLGFLSTTPAPFLGSDQYLIMIFLPGNLGGLSHDPDSNGGGVWCVRGPMSPTGY